MKKLLLILLLCLPCAALASPADEALDRMFKRYSTLGASVAVFQNGEITYTHTYGVARPGGEAITEDTLFQVGSISKMVANVGLMQLLEEQGLSLDSPIGDVLGYAVAHPQYPQEPITLRQLMTHTAALRDSTTYEHAIAGQMTPLSDLLSLPQCYWEDRRPGTRREYANVGGGIIGSLIEALSGETLDHALQRRLFGPLGVTAAYHVRALPEDAPVADIYRMPQKYAGRILRNDSTVISQPNPQEHYVYTAGKLIISAPDLAKILIALCDGGVYQNTRLLKENTVAEMTTRQDYRGSVTCQTGHGLFMNIITNDQVEGRTLYGHGGRAYGMLCVAYFDPTDRTGVVMLTNGCQSDAMHNGVGMLGRRILTLCYEQIIGGQHRVEDPFEVTE